MKERLNFKQNILIGSLLFGLFFGAGNLIFPVKMGQSAGSNMLPATIGFLITGVHTIMKIILICNIHCFLPFPYSKQYNFHDCM